jgi:hypothetical protein
MVVHEVVCAEVFRSRVQETDERWEMDLSPGIVTFPFNPVILHNSIILFLISAIRLHK